MQKTQTTLPDVNELILLFNRLFKESENTILVKGDDEPIYLPADNKSPYNRVIFAHGYFTSALHEISHWCIAGKERRKRIDFGYWYEPDGRSIKQQKCFEQVEVKPQALEWILAQATGKRFSLSSDNLSGESKNLFDFKIAVYEQVQRYLDEGLPERALIFRDVVARNYQRTSYLSPRFFQQEAI